MNLELSLLEQKAFDLLWNDLNYRKAVAYLNHDWVRNQVGQTVLKNEGLDVNQVSSFKMYAATILKINEVLEETNSGQWTDGLFFWKLNDIEEEVRNVKMDLRRIQQMDYQD